MEIQGKVAVITGAGSGIGQTTAMELARRKVGALALVDMSDSVAAVAAKINSAMDREIAYPFIGNTSDTQFRREVFDQIERRAGVPHICVPAAGITRDALAVKLDRTTGQASIYAEELFEQVVKTNLIAPTYWGLEMVARIAQDRFRKGLGPWKGGEHVVGTIVFIGSVSSQGNKGQIAYAATKRGLEGVAATMMKEGMFWGVRCVVIHPGFTDTPMVRKMGEELIQKTVIPFTQLKRLIKPEEIADAICYLISNSAISGELWCDAGWHPSA